MLDSIILAPAAIAVSLISVVAALVSKVREYNRRDEYIERLETHRLEFEKMYKVVLADKKLSEDEIDKLVRQLSILQSDLRGAESDSRGTQARELHRAEGEGA